VDYPDRSDAKVTVLLFHHAQGQTHGFLAFAEELRAAGHIVHAPDLYEGRTFGTVEEGVANAQKIGFDEIIRRGVTSAESLPTDIVYAGFSMGVMPAQSLTQKRAGARGALFYHGCVPPSTFGSWPVGVPVEIHMMEKDKWLEEDLDSARALVKEVPNARLFMYPGSGHLFADTSSPDYDAAAAVLLMERTLAFLRRVAAPSR
jgi:dienelactone hydrolase